MDLIEEVNAFSDWIETNSLETSAQTLWFHLMVIANKSGWPEWFAVSNPLLQAKAGISENTLLKNRNVLVQKGRIEYRSQGKKKDGKYRIISITANIEVNRGVMEGVNRGVMEGVNRGVMEGVHKDLKDLKDLRSTTATPAREANSLTEAYSLVFGGGTLPALFTRFFIPVMQQHGERYAIELMLESGESGNRPSLRHIESIHTGWQSRGIRSREEARAEKQLAVPKQPANSHQSRNEEALRKIREAEERERVGSQENISRDTEYV